MPRLWLSPIMLTARTLGHLAGQRPVGTGLASPELGSLAVDGQEAVFGSVGHWLYLSTRSPYFFFSRDPPVLCCFLLRADLSALSCFLLVAKTGLWVCPV